MEIDQFKKLKNNIYVYIHTHKYIKLLLQTQKKRYKNPNLLRFNVHKTKEYNGKGPIFNAGKKIKTILLVMSKE